MTLRLLLVGATVVVGGALLVAFGSAASAGSAQIGIEWSDWPPSMIVSGRARGGMAYGAPGARPLSRRWRATGAADLVGLSSSDPTPVYLPVVHRHFDAQDRLPPSVVPDPCAGQVGGPPSEGRGTPVELSAAHAGIRFFGLAERYSSVDQALLAAFRNASGSEWPEDARAQERFLEAYAEPLDGVCALPAEERTLGPVQVRLTEDAIAVVRPGLGPVDIPVDARAVAVDLRDVPNVPELRAALTSAVAPALAQPLLGAQRRVRQHSGLKDEVYSIANVYRNRIIVQEGAPVPAESDVERPLLLLTGTRQPPDVAELAGSLRLANRAVILGEDVRSDVAESRWSPIGATGISWRAADLRHGDPPEPTIRLEDLEPEQDDCGAWNDATIKHDFRTDSPTVRVTVYMTGTTGTGPGTATDLDLLVLYDRDGDGELELWDEFMGGGTPHGTDSSNEIVIVEELLPPGRWQVWVLGCRVPDESVRADVSVVMQSGFRWPDVIPADLRTRVPEAWLAEGLAMATDIPDVAAAPPARPELRPVASFDDVQPLGAGAAERRAALVVLHGAYRQFFPYFDVVGDGIDARLIETLAAEPPSGQHGRKSVIYALRRLAEVVHDGHSAFYNYGAAWEDFRLPLLLEPLNGEPVVRRSAVSGIEPGDVVMAIDGRQSLEVYDDEYLRTSAATPGNRFHLASSYILRREGPTTLTLRAPSGITRTHVVTAAGTSTLDLSYSRPSGWLADLGGPDVYYLNLDTSATKDDEQLRASLAESMSAVGLVVDMRGYPGSVNTYEAVRRLVTDTVRSSFFRTTVYDGPDQSTIRERQYELPPLLEPHFHGPIVLLVGTRTVSAAENFASMLVAEPRVTVVGQRSAGTNGNVTGVQLPGGFGVLFTGMEVLFPDRRTFHGVGIVPDVEAVPSAEDYRDGLDRELVTAVELLERP